MEKDTGKSTLFETIAGVIVDKRNIVFLVFAAVAVFCAFSRNWVNINEDLTVYLGEETETRIGLDLMDEQFTEFATAKVMVDNITLAKAHELLELIETVSGVHDVAFDDSGDHYTSAGALYEVTFLGGATSNLSIDAMKEIENRLSAYDVYVTTEVGSPEEVIIEREMSLVDALAVLIIVSVLLFTSKTYMEVPILLVTFGAAALINMGTNYWFDSVSYVTDSISVVLQLALAIDYAIILCHRYTEEREKYDAREATVRALSKAIPEISASSLTTVSGLAALTLMSFTLGRDMGLVLIKAIVISMLTVFTLMPGLLVLFSKAMDRSHHKSFVPKIAFLGRLAYKTRYIVPPLFVLAAVAACVFSAKCSYAYSPNTVDAPKQNFVKISRRNITETFGGENLLAILVPAGDYDTERQLLRELESYGEVESVLGLCTIEAKDDYMLTDKLSPREFSELAGLDIEVARALYAAYAVREEDYGQIVSDINEYRLPLIDVFIYLYEQKQEGYAGNLDEELSEELDELYGDIMFAKVQLQGEEWSRLLLHIDMPEESEDTFEFLDTVHAVAQKYYETVYLVGESVNNYDLSESFSGDNRLISILSAVFVITVLLFSFRSVGLPMLLIAVIQSSIWLNFSIPFLTGNRLFFISYLIVSAIQMGANIDYAIVISSRYMELKRDLPIKDAMVESLNAAFPTIITSGMMLASAGILIGVLTSDNTISSIGVCMGRGTIISIFLVMFVLPQILLLGDSLIEKTSFRIKGPDITRIDGSTIRIRGRVRGQISGYIDAEVSGLFQGSLAAIVESGVPVEPPALTPPETEEKEDGR